MESEVRLWWKGRLLWVRGAEEAVRAGASSGAGGWMMAGAVQVSEVIVRSVSEFRVKAVREGARSKSPGRRCSRQCLC